MWQVVRTPIDAARFGPFEPLHILNAYDGPRIFTLRDAGGVLCLACWSDDDEACSRYLVVPTTQATVADLSAGLLSVWEALRQPCLWVVDLSHQGPVVAAWLVVPDAVPDDARPQPGVTLHRPQTPPRSVSIDGGPSELAGQSPSKRL